MQVRRVRDSPTSRRTRSRGYLRERPGIAVPANLARQAAAHDATQTDASASWLARRAVELSRSDVRSPWGSVAIFWPHRVINRCDTSTNDERHSRSSTHVYVCIHEPLDLLLIRGFRVRVPGGVSPKLFLRIAPAGRRSEHSPTDCRPHFTPTRWEPASNFDGAARRRIEIYPPPPRRVPPSLPSTPPLDSPHEPSSSRYPELPRCSRNQSRAALLAASKSLV